MTGDRESCTALISRVNVGRSEVERGDILKEMEVGKKKKTEEKKNTRKEKRKNG
jgi:hypothetical protein